MKRISLIALAIVAAGGLTVSSRAGIVVRDTWQDSDRTDPAPPTYSENGVDSDLDTDIESAWFNGGSGNALNASPGQLSMVFTSGTASASWTTYFTPEGSELTLSNPGDVLKVTWVFSLVGVNTGNTSQNFRLALVDSPSAARLTVDGSPGAGAYTGYGIFANMATTLGNGNSFALMERNTASGNLLGTSGDWVNRANGAGSGVTGYSAGPIYTNVWTLTKTGSGLDIVVSMSGDNIGGSGAISVSFSDTTPNGLAYDTFAIRPSNSQSTATEFDTRLFQVDFTAIPEPSTIMLLVSGIGLMLTVVRRIRR